MKPYTTVNLRVPTRTICYPKRPQLLSAPTTMAFDSYNPPSPLTTPPFFEFPPVILSDSIDSSTHPFSDTLTAAPIPRGIRPFLISPTETLLKLDFPCSIVPMHTPSFRERVDAFPVKDSFANNDACDVVRPEDLTLNFSAYSIRPSGYSTVPIPYPLPIHFSPLHHVHFEVNNNNNDNNF